MNQGDPVEVDVSDDLLNEGSGDLRPRDATDKPDRDLLQGGSGELGNEPETDDGDPDPDTEAPGL